jgi:hypothetical protein
MSEVNTNTPAHLYLFTTPANWRNVLGQNERVSPKYWLKLLRFIATSLVAEPARLYENARFEKQIEDAPLHEQPLFIMGAWRSGTTHLHNLLSQDPAYSYVTTLQCLAPHFILSQQTILRRTLAGLLPEKRLFDNVELGLDAPQEEEVGLATLSPHSYYQYWFFPQRILPLFEKYIQMRTMSAQEWAEWRASYLRLLKTASFMSGGKPLLLKSPGNLARTRTLLEMFPQAKFVEIQRDPLRVWISLMHIQKVLVPIHHLQDFSWEKIRADKLYVYTTLMRQWQEEKALIPPENLVTIRYEDLVANPLPELERAYAQLSLPTAEAFPRWSAYLETIKTYQVNNLNISPQDLALARNEFRFMYEAGGYPIP